MLTVKFLEGQDGFIQKKKNAKTYSLRSQPPATEVRANSSSPLQVDLIEVARDLSTGG